MYITENDKHLKYLKKIAAVFEKMNTAALARLKQLGIEDKDFEWDFTYYPEEKFIVRIMKIDLETGKEVRPEIGFVIEEKEDDMLLFKKLTEVAMDLGPTYHYYASEKPIITGTNDRVEAFTTEIINYLHETGDENLNNESWS